MTTSASLVVRISADINDFTKSLDKAEKAVLRASERIARMGKELTMTVTLPAIAAGAALVHFTGDMETTANRMNRVFGPAANGMNAQIEKLRTTIPATTTELRKMAILARGELASLGVASPKANPMVPQMLKMAGNMSAFSGKPIDEAMMAIDRALAGRGRGLVDFGLTMSRQEIKQEAFRQGFIRTGETISETGTALAAYSVLMRKATALEGESARVSGDASRQFAFLKADLFETAGIVGKVLLPAFVSLSHGLREVFQLISKIPSGFLTFAAAVVGMVAVLGPALVFIGSMTKAILALRVAMALLADGAVLKGLLLIFTNPALLLGIAALAIAIGALVAIWKHYHPQEMKAAVAGVTTPGIFDGGKNRPTSEDLRAPFDQWLERAKSAIEFMKVAPSMGAGPWIGKGFAGSASAMKEGYGRLRGLDTFSKEAAEARSQLLELESIANTKKMYNALSSGGSAQAVMYGIQRQPYDSRLAAAQQMTAESTSYGQGLEKRRHIAASDFNPFEPVAEAMIKMHDQIIATKNDLNMRASLLRLTDGFDAAKTAAVEFGERVRASSNTWNKTIADFKLQWGSGSGRGASAKTGIQDAVGGLIQSFSPAGLAMQAFGKIMQGLQPVLDQLMGPLVAFGQILAIAITPILHPLFEALKGLALMAAYVGEFWYSVASGLARIVGNIWVAIGKIISKIPFIGGIGDGIQDVGNGLISLATSFSITAGNLGKAAGEIKKMDFASAANGIDMLTKATASVNIPQGFKVALAQFNAQPAQRNGAQWYPNSQQASQNITINVNGATEPKAVAKAVLTAFRSTASQTFRDSTRWPELQTI